jgi:LuxR family maltose regulon positive regulatory protein
VLDYLIEEVLEQQSESVQAFLLQSSILPRLTGSLCDALTGQDNGQTTLELLERVMDNERRWYRYHHLFADLLRQRLFQTQQEQLPILHRRASEWYEQNGFGNEAIDHAIRSQNFERVADLVEKYIGGNYYRIDQTTMQRWLAELPEDIICSKPQLCLLQAWNLYTSGQLDAADRSLQVAEKLLTPNTDGALLSSLDQDQLSDTNRLRLLGRTTTLRSFIASYSGDIPGTIQHANQALDYLPEEELEWRSAALITLGDIYASQGQMHQVRSEALLTAKASGDPYILMIANLSLAEILRQQGQLQPVIEICKRNLKIAEDGGMSESAIVGWLFGIWGEVLAELNELDRASDLAKKGVKLAARGRDMTTIGFSNLYMVRVLFSSGNMTSAEEVIQTVENTARESDMSYWTLLQLSAWKVRIWLAQGKLEEAFRWVGESELDPAGELTYLHEMEYIVLARILIAQGQLDEATTLLLRLLEVAEAGGRISKVIELLILQVLAFQAKGDKDRAMTTLEKALTLAEPESFFRIFVDEGPQMAHLLYEALSRGMAPDYVRRLLAAFPIAEPEKSDLSESQIPGSDIVEPLSEREIEVLQLIAEGFTNQEIATQLYISLNTVKVHTRNINGKLGAKNRTGAVVRARTLGILHPT